MDLLDSLADVSVPPVPGAAGFTAGVRRKLHPRLLAGHVAAFAVLAMPVVMGQAFAALAAVARLTLSGAWPAGRRTDPGDR